MEINFAENLTKTCMLCSKVSTLREISSRVKRWILSPALSSFGEQGKREEFKFFTARILEEKKGN